MNDEFELDDILAEFSDYTEEAPTPPKPQSAAKPAEKKSEPHASRSEWEERPGAVPPKREVCPKPAPTEQKVRPKPVPQKREEAKRPLYEKNPERDERRRTAAGPGKAMIAALFAVLSLFVLSWVAVNVHPDSGTVTAETTKNDNDLSRRVDMFLNNLKSEALSDLAYIKKIYTIPESALSAPRPNEAAFGVTQDMSVIQSVIDGAAELLEGQSLVWNPELDFYPDRNVYYYSDPTILVLVWRERINNRSATVAEIKVADGSQLRRKLAADTYGSSVQAYASKLAADANAVVAMNADFYGFRQIGVTVFQRQLFRFSPGKLDNCFINSKGDMLFVKAGAIGSEAEMWNYMLDNDVLFSLSFGPILVDNGVLQHCDSYPIGEIDIEYSRAGLGMVGDLHYLYMTVNHCNGQNPRCRVNEFAELMYQKGCYKAYNLDGGQTSEIVMHGKPINYIDFNAERTVTDIIYFATALPESEVS